MPYYHGPKMTSVVAITAALTAIAMSPIGVIVTADDANAATFPENTAIEMPAFDTATYAKCGTTGTMLLTMKAIAAQGYSPKTVVVRVAEGADAAATEVNVLAGLVKLKESATQFDFALKLLASPGLESIASIDAIATAAQEEGGFSYAAIAGADVAAAIADRANHSHKNAMLLWPATVKNGADNVPIAALALGQRVAIDADSQRGGLSKTLSNVVMTGLDDIGMPIDFNGETSIANTLNAADITTVIRRDGFRFWGNRTGSTEPMWAFESDVRIDALLADIIRDSTYESLDKLTNANALEDKVEELQVIVDGLAREGLIVDGNVWIDPSLNTADALADGQVFIKYDFTVPKPFEQPNFEGRITNKYLVQILPELT